MTKYRLHLFQLFCASLVLAGCASTQSVPEDHFYRLTPLSVAEPYTTPPFTGVIKVERVKAFGIFQERAVLFSHEQTPETLERYHYHFWVDAPTVLIRKHMVAYLRKRGIAQLVVGGETQQTGDVRLQLELNNFERILSETGAVQVKVGLGLVVKVGREEKPLLIKNYSSLKKVDDQTMSASIQAFNQGLETIYQQLSDDLTVTVASQTGN